MRKKGLAGLRDRNRIIAVLLFNEIAVGHVFRLQAYRLDYDLFTCSQY